MDHSRDKTKIKNKGSQMGQATPKQLQPKSLMLIKPCIYSVDNCLFQVQERDVVYALPEPPQANAPTAKRQSLFKQNRRR